MSLFEINHHVHETVHATTHVTEKRAPTDESIRLLREMEAAARQAVTDSVRVAGCPIDMVLHTQRDALNARQLFRAVYSVNGQRSVVDAHLHEEAGPDAITRTLIDALSQDIAAKLLAPHIGELFRTRRSNGTT